MKRMALGLVALLVVGCSAGGGLSAPPVGTPGAPMTGAPASAAASPSDPIPALAAAYMAIADKANAKLDQCGKDMTAAGSDLTKAKVAAQECLDAENLFGTDLGARRWGPVQAQIDDVIKSLGKEQVLLGQMAGASDVASFMAADSQLAAAGGDVVGAVNVLRSALGLPPSGPLETPKSAPPS